MNKQISLYVILLTFLLVGCKQQVENETKEVIDKEKYELNETDQPIITKMFTADPSAHVFNDRIYVYPSHDYESGIPNDESGNHFDMRDYHVFSMDSVGGKVTDHGKALDIDNVEWASRQMWAPDAAKKDGKYFLYFPAKDKDDIFRIGVATSDMPEGPFKPEQSYIENSYSIDPSVFEDNGEHYMFFGGIWGGQLQWYRNNKFMGKEDIYPEDGEAALKPKIVKMGDDMISFAETPRDIEILDKDGKSLVASDNDRRFYEGAWVHKYNDNYYLSYSTGDTHKIVYATSKDVYGPYVYQGVVLNPVLGWTNHHSIVEFNDKWYLFYHDSSLSGGKTHLRSVKVTELEYNDDGSIIPMDKMVQPKN